MAARLGNSRSSFATKLSLVVSCPCCRPKIGSAQCGSIRPACRGSCRHRTCRRSTPRQFTLECVCSKPPTFHKFAGELCSGAQIHVTDRNAFRPFETGIKVIRVIRRLYPDHFAWKQPPYEYETEKLPIEILLGGPVKEFFGD